MGWETVAGAAIGAGASLFGSSKASNSAKEAAEIQAQMQRETNAMQVAEAQKNREFQYEMSGSAHQREVRDLKLAGLNPILSATGGSGASTGQGSMAVLKNPYEGYGSTVGTAKMQEAQMNAQALGAFAKTAIEAALADSQIKLNDEKAGEAKMNAAYMQESAYKKILEMDTELLIQGKTDAERKEIMSRILLNSAKTMESEQNARTGAAQAGMYGSLSAQAQEQIKNINENTKLTEQQKKLLIQKVTSGTYASEVSKWTGPVREIFHTAEDLVDIINPFK